MDSKTKVAILIPGMLAILLFISSEVAARDLKEEGVLKETSKVGDAKLVGGGLQGSGRGSPTPVFPGRGIPGRGFPGQGFPGQGFPGQGFPGQGFPFPGQGYPLVPGQGFPGQGFPGQGFPGQGFPGQGFPGQFRCINGCCYGNARGCLACC
ncbi:hypothetical protein JHK87_038823 [Glycine soja]|nr:hypothetical protein JHK87_038823 [Glycine soja]KAG4962162.1 hypothetical protein JHK86_039030 [Glycine max]